MSESEKVSQEGLSTRQLDIGAVWITRNNGPNRAEMRGGYKNYRKGIADRHKKWKEISDKLRSRINKEVSHRSRKIGEERKKKLDA